MGDFLTKYNNTSDINYDSIGNPTSYRDGMTMSWNGRELQSIKNMQGIAGIILNIKNTA